MARATTEGRPATARATRQPARHRSTRRALWPWLALAALLAMAVIVPVSYLAAGSRGGSALAVLQTSDFHALAFSPDDPNVVFFGHHNGVMRSDDGGRTWKPLVDRRNLDAMGLAVDRANPRRIYLAGHDLFQVSTDGGASWQPVAHNLPGTDIHGFAMSPDDPSRLYAFVVGSGVVESADGGRTWQRLGGQVPGDVMGLAAAGGNPETLYGASMRAGVLKSGDGGKTWTPSNSGLGSTNVMALAVDPADRRIVYAGTEDGLYRSDDAGASWRKLAFPGKNAVALALSLSNPKTILAIEVAGRSEGRVYRSEDGGSTWGERG